MTIISSNVTGLRLQRIQLPNLKERAMSKKYKILLIFCQLKQLGFLVNSTVSIQTTL